LAGIYPLKGVKCAKIGKNGKPVVAFRAAIVLFFAKTANF
jgi:hypothetical protein